MDEHYGLWLTIGGVLVAFGTGTFVLLLTGSTPPGTGSPVFWPAVVALLLGVYPFAAPFLGLPLPRARTQPVWKRPKALAEAATEPEVREVPIGPDRIARPYALGKADEGNKTPVGAVDSYQSTMQGLVDYQIARQDQRAHEARLREFLNFVPYGRPGDAAKLLFWSQLEQHLPNHAIWALESKLRGAVKSGSDESSKTAREELGFELAKLNQLSEFPGRCNSCPLPRGGKLQSDYIN